MSELFSESEQKESEPVSSIELLPGQLGFVETEELSQMRERLVKAYAFGNEEEISELARDYHLAAENIINNLAGENFPKGQIGLIITMGLMRRDGGRIDAYNEDLQDALDYSRNMGYRDVVLVLTAAIRTTKK